LVKKVRDFLIPIILLVAAFLIILDQVIRFGIVWEWNQVFHHENFALALISLALGMLLSHVLLKKN